MSCYLPLVQRWRKPPTPQNPTKEQPKKAAARQQAEEPTGLEPDLPTEVEARRDNRGVTLSQKVGDVTLHIRHDNPQLGLNDVAYQRLHQEHTRKKKSRDDSSLTLPLGISSLRLASKLRGPSRGCESETEGRRGKLAVSQFYQALAGSTATISQQELVREYREEGQGRARRAKMPSVVPKQPRPSSVDADLLMGSRSYGRKEGRKLKYAALTSPSSYMRQGQEKDEKSSSGNSSGSDITSEGSPHPVSEEGEPLHPALRGRTPAPLTGIGRPPPPRHLLPARLRPSPLVKLHPVLVLPPSLRQGTPVAEGHLIIGHYLAKLPPMPGPSYFPINSLSQPVQPTLLLVSPNYPGYLICLQSLASVQLDAVVKAGLHPASLSAFLTLGSWELFITSIFAACSLLRWSPSETLMSSPGIHRGQGPIPAAVNCQMLSFL